MAYGNGMKKNKKNGMKKKTTTKNKKVGLTAKQKKLPVNLQKAILKKQKQNK